MTHLPGERPGDGLLQWAVAGRPRSGGTVSGDLHAVLPFEGGILVAAVDGLGHGDEAALAARTAVAMLSQQPEDSVIGLLRHCHDGLLETRGVVMSLASFNRRDSSLNEIVGGIVEGVHAMT